MRKPGGLEQVLAFLDGLNLPLRIQGGASRPVSYESLCWMRDRLREAVSGETVWVIERGSPTEYLTMQGGDVENERRVSGYPYWSNHAHAIRFARQRDAMMVLGILRDVNTRLPYRDGWEGLRPNDTVQVTELSFAGSHE